MACEPSLQKKPSRTSQIPYNTKLIQGLFMYISVHSFIINAEFTSLPGYLFPC